METKEKKRKRKKRRLYHRLCRLVLRCFRRLCDLLTCELLEQHTAFTFIKRIKSNFAVAVAIIELSNIATLSALFFCYIILINRSLSALLIFSQLSSFVQLFMSSIHTGLGLPCVFTIHFTFQQSERQCHHCVTPVHYWPRN